MESDLSDIFKQAFKEMYTLDKIIENPKYGKVDQFKEEMKAIAQERRIHQGVLKQRERIRKEKLDEPFELGGAL